MLSCELLLYAFVNFNLFLFFKMCICSIYKVLAFSFGSVLVGLISIDCFCISHL